MPGQRRTIRGLTAVIALLALASCAETGQLTDPTEADGTLEAGAASFAKSDNAAVVQTGTFSGPFPPNPAVPFIPVPAPCLGLGEPLQMSGTWSGWFRVVETKNGRVHVTEQIDWSEVDIVLGDLTWRPGPGAFESIVQNLPATADDLGEAAYVVRHQFTIRFLSQDGLPDLRVTHSAKQVLGPDLEFRHNEFVPFTAECIGRSA